MKTNVKHNKIRNTGILFELLVRQITTDVLESKQNGAAVRIMKEFFNVNSELGKELMLYRAFFNVQNLSEQKAFQLLKLVSEQHKTLNQNLLNSQKYKLIKELKANFDLKEFFAARIPSYKVYASIYKVFGTDKKSQFTLINEIADSQFTIVEHLTGKFTSKKLQEHSELATLLRDQEDGTRFLTYKILIERFNQKYKNLDESQKKLLQQYIYNISNTTKLASYIHTEAKQLSEVLEMRSRTVKNTVTRIKLKEVITQMKKLRSVQSVKENHLTALLIGYEIAKEIKTL